MILRLLVLPVLVLWTQILAEDENPVRETKRDTGSATANITATFKPSSSNMTANNTVGYNHNLGVNPSMIQRALFVLIGITIIGVLYFLIRAVRLKKSTVQRKKYGLLSNSDDTMEMAPLESDEEEDMTVYEARSLTR
ncbi:protein FAM174C [Chanos chanos]|uniref:Protein FAM174C n=1 Tax=Chanos chanos TaxID=29144 RepID=A0A6J2W7X2_CHACN|nr:uncharacterized membrane protein C19orf24 homolog [Chanos chanos]